MRWGFAAPTIGLVLIGLRGARPALATLKYGPIELSGSVDTQTLVRTISIAEYQFIQNRNTALLRLDYNWVENGRMVDRFDVPGVKSSKLYLLYRGVYDSFWGAGTAGRQRGVSRQDDLIGGPISGSKIEQACTTPTASARRPAATPCATASLRASTRRAATRWHGRTPCARPTSTSAWPTCRSSSASVASR
jgi:hypothetical protein